MAIYMKLSFAVIDYYVLGNLNIEQIAMTYGDKRWKSESSTHFG